MKIKLNAEQEKLLKLLNETKTPLLITGKAGTGKSLVINTFIERTHKNVAKLATTGMAALNIDGQTIHSFFRLRPDFMEPDRIVASLKNSGTNWYALKATLKKLDTLVIDEISMCDVTLFTTIDRICQEARESSLPFGGLQLILLGDPHQLPPVIKEQDLRKKLIDEYGGVYFYNSPDILKYLKCYELHHIFRQEDTLYKELLDNIREGKDLDRTLRLLNTRVMKPPKDSNCIIITTRNASVTEINEHELDKLPSDKIAYRGEVTGKLTEYPDSKLPTDKKLMLKENALIMMLINDQSGRWVNGSLGRIKKLTKLGMEVTINDKDYEVYPYTWHLFRYEVKDNKVQAIEEGTFTQYPLKLAYAITTHKSQGQTYESVYLKDFNAFEAGQLYVALSRCKSMNNLYLSKPITYSDVIVNKDAIEFMNKIERLNDDN